MNPSQANELLGQAVDEVLSTMFYIFTELVQPGPDQAAQFGQSGVIRVKLAFGGPFQGGLGVYFDQRFGRTLCANFLGEDESEITEPMMLDTAKELTNMIGGRFLVLLEPEKSFLLGLPEAEAQGSAEEALSQAEESLIFESEEGQIMIRLSLEDAK